MDVWHATRCAWPLPPLSCPPDSHELADEEAAGHSFRSPVVGFQVCIDTQEVHLNDKLHDRVFLWANVDTSALALDFSHYAREAWSEPIREIGRYVWCPNVQELPSWSRNGFSPWNNRMQQLMWGSYLDVLLVAQETVLNTHNPFISHLELSDNPRDAIHGVMTLWLVLCVDPKSVGLCLWDPGVLPKYWLLVIMGARQATCSRVITYNSGRVHINIQFNWWPKLFSLLFYFSCCCTPLTARDKDLQLQPTAVTVVLPPPAKPPDSPAVLFDANAPMGCSYWVFLDDGAALPYATIYASAFDSKQEPWFRLLFAKLSPAQITIIFLEDCMSNAATCTIEKQCGDSDRWDSGGVLNISVLFHFARSSAVELDANFMVCNCSPLSPHWNSGSSNDYAKCSPSEWKVDQQYLRPTDWLENALFCTIALFGMAIDVPEAMWELVKCPSRTL